LWGELLSDIAIRKPNADKSTQSTQSDTKQAPIRVQDIDLRPRLEELRLTIRAAHLVYEQCSTQNISDLDRCLERLYDEDYQASKAILPIAEALSASTGDVKEISFTPQEKGLVQASQAEASLKIYCFNPALSFAEKSMWVTLIELTGEKSTSEPLSAAIEKQICREHARF
jgi:hypothetical protein